MLRETRDMYITIFENNIGAPKIRINFCTLILFTSNIGLFSITPCKVIALNLLFFIYGISCLLLFLNALSKVIAPSIKSKSKSKESKNATTIAFVIVVRKITICRAIQKRSH